MLEGRFLLVHLSPPLPDGSWDKAIVVASVRLQAAAKGFWQLKQPVTSPAWKVLQVRELVANECCAARDMCVDGTPSIKPVSFLSNHACICELNAQCRGAHDHIDAHRLAPRQAVWSAYVCECWKFCLFHGVGVVIREMWFLSRLQYRFSAQSKNQRL